MIDLLGAGLRSIADSPVPLDKDVSRLNLHMNRLTSTEGLGAFTKLEELVLSANSIAEVVGLASLCCLRVLDLSSNELERLEGLSGLVSLERLSLAYNRLDSLQFLQDLWGRDSRLADLDLRRNRVAAPAQLLFLGGLAALSELRLAGEGESAALAAGGEGGSGGSTWDGNPVCRLPGYRQAVALASPHLQNLDGRIVHAEERMPSASDAFATGAAEGCGDAAQQHALPVVSLVDLSGRLAALVAELEADSNGAPVSPCLSSRLQEEVLAEAASLRFAEDREAVILKVREAELHKVNGMRRHLAEVALGLQERSARNGAAEQELAAVEAELAAQAADLPDERAARELASEAAIDIALAAELGAMRDAAANSEAMGERALVELRRADEVAPGRVVDLVGLRREWLRAGEALKDVSQRSRGEAEDGAALRAGLPALELQVKLEWRACEGEQAKEHALASRAHELRHESAEASSRLAVALARKAGGFGHAAVDEETSLSRLSAELSKHCNGGDLALEIAACEACVHVAEEELRSGHTELLEVRQSWEKSLSQSKQRCAQLESRLEHMLTDAEEAVGCGRGQVADLQRHLEQQQAVTRRADAQEHDGKYAVARLRLEVERTRCQEALACQSVRELAAAAAQEEHTVAKLADKTRELQTEARAVYLSLTASGFTPLAAHASCLALGELAQAAGSELHEELCARGLAVQRRVTEVATTLGHGAHLAAALADMHKREDWIGSEMRLKGREVAHMREEIEALDAARRRDDYLQQESDASCRRNILSAEATSAEWQELADTWHAETAEASAEAEARRLVVSEEAWHLEEVERQLEDLRSGMAESADAAAAQELRLRARGLHVLGEAQEAMEAMERRFRAERDAELAAQRRLAGELSEAQAQVAEAPAALAAARRRAEAERAASAARVSALLAALGAG